MRRQFVTVTIVTFLLAGPGMTANAQQDPDGAAIRQAQMQQRFERGPSDRYDSEDEYDNTDDRRRPGSYDRGYRMGEGRGHGMEGRRPGMGHHHGPGFGRMGMMGPGMGGPRMMGMMMILMDSDGDGAVSLQEFLAGHERIFKAMDADKDGRVTLEEVRNFRPGARSAPRQ
jgi:hypothetical protein